MVKIHAIRHLARIRGATPEEEEEEKLLNLAKSVKRKIRITSETLNPINIDVLKIKCFIFFKIGNK